MGPPPQSAKDGPLIAGVGPAIQVIDLDQICRPYRRILFSQRLVRAAVAAMAGTTLFAGPAMLIVAASVGGAGFGILAAGGLIVVRASVCALLF